jgi:hypothetical protein
MLTRYQTTDGDRQHELSGANFFVSLRLTQPLPSTTERHIEQAYLAGE